MKGASLFIQEISLSIFEIFPEYQQKFHMKISGEDTFCFFEKCCTPGRLASLTMEGRGSHTIKGQELRLASYKGRSVSCSLLPVICNL